MLVAAGEAFARHGYHGASMDAIAAAARISKPMLYSYFGSKEGLYTAYLARSGAALLDAVRTAAPPEAPARERLARGVIAFLYYVEDHRAGWLVLYGEAVSQTGGAATGVGVLRDRLAAMIARSLPVEVNDDRARSARVAALAGAGEALANWWLRNPEQSKEHICELFLRLADAAATS